MKILLVANTDWYLYNFRLSLAEFLRAKQHEVVMVSPPGKFVPMIEAAGFRWAAWPVERRTINPFTELAAMHSLRRIYRQEAPTLVHQFTIKPVLYGSLAAWHSPISVVDSITGLGYLFLEKSLKIQILRTFSMALYRLIFHQPRVAVIFENQSDRAYFMENHLVSAQNSQVIEGVGVDEERFSPTPEAPGTPLIVLPARLMSEKGIEVMVEAARKLHEITEARVVLVGEIDSGNPTSIAEATVNAWVNEGVVECWGFQNDMQAVFQQAHIIALPSFREGLPTVLIEAAACGRPIVATDVAGCRDVVEDGVNGFLIPPHNAAALADALAKLVADPALRQRMGAAGRQKVLAQFTKAKINADTYQIYQNILPIQK